MDVGRVVGFGQERALVIEPDPVSGQPPSLVGRISRRRHAPRNLTGPDTMKKVHDASLMHPTRVRLTALQIYPPYGFTCYSYGGCDNRHEGGLFVFTQPLPEADVEHDLS